MPALLVWACSPSVDGAADGGEREVGVATYEVALVEGSPARFHVEARLPVTPAGLAMSELGASGLDDGWATFVDSLRLTSSIGERLNVVRDGPRRWAIADDPIADDPTAKGPATLSYQVRLAHDSVTWSGGVDGAALDLPWGAYASGRALFVVPDDLDGPVRVRFRTVGDQVAVAPWPGAAGAAEGTLEAPNSTTFTESYVLVGDFEAFTVERGGFELAFALGGPSVTPRADEFRALAGRSFDYFIELMGDAPRPAPDEPTTRIVVGINEADVTDGEVIGSHINILLSADPDPLSRAFSTFGFVHELFHLWNGKSIRPAGPDDWFTEGITNYYALKALHAAGELSDDEVFGLVSNLFYARYVSDDGYGGLSLREAVEDKHGHWGLVYGGGMFAGLCLDAGMRRASGDTATLDDVMRDMFDRFGGSEAEFGVEDVAEVIRERSGYDPSGFLDRHVKGAEPIPVAECLADLGFEASVDDGPLRIERSDGVDKDVEARVEAVLGTRDHGVNRR